MDYDEDDDDDDLSTFYMIAATVLIIGIGMLVLASIYTAKLSGKGWRYPTSIVSTVFTVFIPLLGIVPPILYKTA
tara:strand:- start:498 stop:722 length:225 start_codon:yes stop_codon:yes gene_type:complete